MLGMFSDFVPKFVKQYAKIGESMKQAFLEYKKQIQEGSFPAKEHCYTIQEDIIEKLY